ncbi:MAG TPA: TIM barrel protein [Verrucomicrobiae bacterium]|jgi:hydroxypyruvate isomerase|nr:TIM barrel protein [Verrucomicrobiae bacterium]
MSTKFSRRSAFKKTAVTGAAMLTMSRFVETMDAAESPSARKGNVNHSVCRWCYDRIPLEDLCRAAKDMGIESVELQGPKEWPTIQKYGLTCAMANGAGMGIEKGWNRLEHHDSLIESYAAVIPQAKNAGLQNLICFSGNRAGLDDEQGIKNCALGLKKLMPVAEKHGINVVMELLNSKVNHKDYQCDHTVWGVELVKAVGSERFKLLYDIYHMQIMEGDVIATIRQYHPYIVHYHTGGVPGRHEIDDSQELNYKPIMAAILKTGFKGHVAQEFIPARTDAIASLKQGVDICDV